MLTDSSNQVEIGCAYTSRTSYEVGIRIAALRGLNWRSDLSGWSGNGNTCATIEGIAVDAVALGFGFIVD